MEKMTADDFWARAKDIFSQFQDGDAVGVDFFKGDMEELFEEWEEKSQDLERKMF